MQIDRGQINGGQICGGQIHRGQIYRGLPPGARDAAAALVAEAFARKLRAPLGRGTRAQAFLARAIDPGKVLSAVAPDGRLLGVAGYQVAGEGGFVGGTLSDLAAIYGWPSAIWRSAVFLALYRPAPDGCLKVETICVAAGARGRGVGTALLRALEAEAAQRGLGELRLEVTDTNPRAQALYQRAGFRSDRVSRMGPLGPIFGFARVIGMRRPVGASVSSAPAP